MSKVVDLLLVGGSVYSNGNLVEASVGIEDGRIAFLSAEGWTPAARRTLDMRGKILVPGFIDTHVHFRDPGLTYKEDFQTGTQAAAAGGVTTVVDMPNNKPALLTRDRFRAKRDSVGERALVDYALYAGATNLAEIPGMVEEGAIGVKIFMVADPKSH